MILSAVRIRTPTFCLVLPRTSLHSSLHRPCLPDRTNLDLFFHSVRSSVSSAGSFSPFPFIMITDVSGFISTIFCSLYYLACSVLLPLTYFTQHKCPQGLSIWSQMARQPSFLWLIFVCLLCIFFTQSSTNGHLGCLHVLATVNTAAQNSGTSFRVSVFVSFR